MDHRNDKNYKYTKIATESEYSALKTEDEKKEYTQIGYLYYKLSNEAWCCIRPSGNEPQIKYYIGVKGKSFEDSNKQIEELEKLFKDNHNQYIESLFNKVIGMW